MAIERARSAESASIELNQEPPMARKAGRVAIRTTAIATGAFVGSMPGGLMAFAGMAMPPLGIMIASEAVTGGDVVKYIQVTGIVYVAGLIIGGVAGNYVGKKVADSVLPNPKQ